MVLRWVPGLNLQQGSVAKAREVDMVMDLCNGVDYYLQLI